MGHWDPAQIVQILIGLLVLAATLGVRWGRLEAKRPLSIAPEKPLAGNGTEWRTPLEALKVEVAGLRTKVQGAETRRDDLIKQNQREHDALAARIDRNEDLLNAHQRRLDQLADRE